jgi:hypothetical protein
VRRRLVALAAAAVVLAGLWAFYAMSAQVVRGGESAPLYSAYRHDLYGTAALRELLVDRGTTVQVLEQPHLQDRSRGLLIQVLPLEPKERSMLGLRAGPGPALQLSRLCDWVAEGNTVVQFTREQTALMKRLKITLDEGSVARGPAESIEKCEARGDPPAKLPGSDVPAEWTRAGLAFLGGDKTPRHPLMLHGPCTFDGKSGASDWTPLAVIGGRTVAAEMRLGQGRVILVGAPSPALNGWIEGGGNVDFLLALAGNGPVILDEWSHGLGNEGSIMGLLRSFGLLPVLFQIMVLLALYVWSTLGHRRADCPTETRRRSNAEQVETLGYLYSSVISRAETCRRVRNEVICRVAATVKRSPAEVEGGRLPISAEQQREIAPVLEALKELDAAPRRGHHYGAMFRALTRSHALIKEKKGERRISKSS